MTKDSPVNFYNVTNSNWQKRFLKIFKIARYTPFTRLSVWAVLKSMAWDFFLARISAVFKKILGSMKWYWAVWIQFVRDSCRIPLDEYGNSFPISIERRLLVQSIIFFLRNRFCQKEIVILQNTFYLNENLARFNHWELF